MFQKIQTEEATGLGCAMLADSAMVAIGNETAGSGAPCASQKETHVVSTSTASLGASTTSEAHTSDMPLHRKSLEGRGLSDSATSLILQSWRKGTKQPNHSSLNGNSTVVKGRLILFQQLKNMGLISWQNFNKRGLDIVPSIQHVVLYPLFVFVGQHPLVCRFIKGIFECRPSPPRYQETWDVTVVLDFFAQNCLCYGL